MKNEQIDKVFQTIRHAKPEMDWSAVEQFVLTQPAAAFVPKGVGKSIGLNVKNSFIMITSICVIGVAQLMLSMNHTDSKPGKQAMVSVTDSIQKRVDIPQNSDTVPLNSTLFTQETTKKALEPAPEIPRIEEKVAFSCDDEQHIARDFYEEMLKDKLIEKETFDFKMNASSLWINGEKKDAEIVEKYRNILKQKGISVNRPFKIVVRSVNCGCSIKINVDEPENMPLRDTIKTVKAPIKKYSTSGKMVLDPFTELDLLSSADVMLVSGDSFAVEAIDGALLEKGLIKVQNGRLQILSSGKSKSEKGFITVYVPSDKLERIYITGSGNLHIGADLSGIKVLDVKSSGSIMCTKTIRTDTISMRIMGSGVIEINELNAQSTKVEVMGSGFVFSNGSSQHLKATVKGSGGVRWDKCNVETADLNISGSGEIRAFVSKKLVAEVTGSGTIQYRGSPNEVRENVLGSGEIIKKL